MLLPEKAAPEHAKRAERDAKEPRRRAAIRNTVRGRDYDILRETAIEHARLGVIVESEVSVGENSVEVDLLNPIHADLKIRGREDKAERVLHVVRPAGGAQGGAASQFGDAIG